MNTQEYSDEDLVRRCQSELPYQTGTFAILMERYQKRVFQKAYSMLKNRDEANDLVQDIFVKLFHALPEFGFKASFSTWIYAVTTNTCLNHIEKMKRRPWWWLTEDVDDRLVDVQQDEELFLIASQAVEQEELAEAINLTLQSLGEMDQEVLRLRYFEEMEYKNISDRLGIGLSAVKMRIKRARESFKQAFQNMEQENNG